MYAFKLETRNLDGSISKHSKSGSRTEDGARANLMQSIINSMKDGGKVVSWEITYNGRIIKREEY